MNNPWMDPMAWSRRKSIVSGVIVLLAIVVLAVMSNLEGWLPDPTAPRGKLTLENIPFNGERAYQHLKDICAIGPRIAGSKGMLEQQEQLTKHFESLGAKVTQPEFFIRHPQTGERTRIANLIVEFHPDRKDRMLLCAHYDTRPYPDPDPRKPARHVHRRQRRRSGVAVLMELAHNMKDLRTKAGVDFVLFDGEELVYQEGDQYFVGSEYFAREYASNPPRHRYRWGVLLDMVRGQRARAVSGDATACIGRTHVRWSKTSGPRPRGSGSASSSPRVRHEVRDDHLMLRNIGRIPTCDIIDFDYPVASRNASRNYWHTSRHARELLGPLAGQSRLGDQRVAEGAEVRQRSEVGGQKVGLVK